MTQAVVTALLALSAFFLLVSTVGLLRLPDFFSRTHAVGKSETLGALLCLAALAVHAGPGPEMVKLAMIVFLVAITNPTGVHTLTRAALRRGLRIWTGAGQADPKAPGQEPPP